MLVCVCVIRPLSPRSISLITRLGGSTKGPLLGWQQYIEKEEEEGDDDDAGTWKWKRWHETGTTNTKRVVTRENYKLLFLCCYTIFIMSVHVRMFSHLLMIIYILFLQIERIHFTLMVDYIFSYLTFLPFFLDEIIFLINY
jgi:hypothetical protein